RLGVGDHPARRRTRRGAPRPGALPLRLGGRPPRHGDGRVRPPGPGGAAAGAARGPRPRHRAGPAARRLGRLRRPRPRSAAVGGGGGGGRAGGRAAHGPGGAAGGVPRPRGRVAERPRSRRRRRERGAAVRPARRDRPAPRARAGPGHRSPGGTAGQDPGPPRAHHRKESTVRVVICGAGIAGLSLAWWLERAGWEVLVVEHAPGQRGAGYLIDFFGPGYDAVERMGLLPRVRERARTVAGVRYRDSAGRVTCELPYDALVRLQRGRVVTLMRGELEDLLFEALGPGVEFRYSTSVDAVATAADHVAVTLTTGEVERADLLVGADGI